MLYCLNAAFLFLSVFGVTWCGSVLFGSCISIFFSFSLSIFKKFF